jgi:hypothetical protein
MLVPWLKARRSLGSAFASKAFSADVISRVIRAMVQVKQKKKRLILRVQLGIVPIHQPPQDSTHETGRVRELSSK